MSGATGTSNVSLLPSFAASPLPLPSPKLMTLLFPLYSSAGRGSQRRGEEEHGTVSTSLVGWEREPKPKRKPERFPTESHLRSCWARRSLSWACRRVWVEPL